MPGATFVRSSLSTRPHSSAVVMEENLASINTPVETSLATAVPGLPLENPTSAALRAGASVVCAITRHGYCLSKVFRASHEHFLVIWRSASQQPKLRKCAP